MWQLDTRFNTVGATRCHVSLRKVTNEKLVEVFSHFASSLKKLKMDRYNDINNTGHSRRSRSRSPRESYSRNVRQRRAYHDRSLSRSFDGLGGRSERSHRDLQQRDRSRGLARDHSSYYDGYHYYGGKRYHDSYYGRSAHVVRDRDAIPVDLTIAIVRLMTDLLHVVTTLIKTVVAVAARCLVISWSRQDIAMEVVVLESAPVGGP
ncbi:hypothetical protein F442_17058 [Phytophthora nicotianae P10297]|uniref:Uncharacterized protein n=1 Tax=Phytophthora nicotianae P10297 TaxID=1317064 RepID=W2YI81_PHYNI|nr:hypothetical protein F442_17058 [Phytophthora nicotianae P10297]